LWTLFFRKGAEVFCCARTKNNTIPRWFKFNSAKKSFINLQQKPPELALPRKYHHKGITERFSDKTRLMEFIDWDVLRKHDGMEKALQKRDKYLKKMQENKFSSPAAGFSELKKACGALFKKRKSIKKFTVKEIKSRGKPTAVEVELPQYGQKGCKPLFMLRVNKAKYTGTRWSNYIDQAVLYFFDGQKYRTFNRLSTGMKHAAIMAFLMNQEAFGPLIIDEPEQYLDVGAITKTLVPRMRLLKTQQQIICVTNDEHILLLGDAENVIATQSEKSIEVVTGDINDLEIQQQVLEIFEGDRLGRALQDKNRKLACILSAER
jgi:hypothetical protein